MKDSEQEATTTSQVRSMCPVIIVIKAEGSYYIVRKAALYRLYKLLIGFTRSICSIARLVCWAAYSDVWQRQSSQFLTDLFTSIRTPTTLMTRDEIEMKLQAIYKHSYQDDETIFKRMHSCYRLASIHPWMSQIMN
jgi:hypothetical protein